MPADQKGRGEQEAAHSAIKESHFPVDYFPHEFMNAFENKLFRNSNRNTPLLTV